MTDRELLELAAKAAGIVLEYEETTGRCFTRGGFYDLVHIYDSVHNGHGFRVYWNPLTDDGDALRLAVKLGLLIDTQYNNGVGVGSASFEEVWESTGVEPYAATRRAIVRAAAEIGRAMK